MKLSVVLGATLARSFSFTLPLHAGLLVALSALDFREYSRLLNFFLEPFESLFNALSICNSNFRQGSSPLDTNQITNDYSLSHIIIDLYIEQLDSHRKSKRLNVSIPEVKLPCGWVFSESCPSSFALNGTSGSSVSEPPTDTATMLSTFAWRISDKGDRPSLPDNKQVRHIAPDLLAMLSDYLLLMLLPQQSPH